VLAPRTNRCSKKKQHKISYPNTLRKLKLPTLMYRRARGDMTETYKLGKYDDQASLQLKSKMSSFLAERL